MRRRVDLGGSETRTVLETVSVRFFIGNLAMLSCAKIELAPTAKKNEPNLGDLAGRESRRANARR